MSLLIKSFVAHFTFLKRCCSQQGFVGTFSLFILLYLVSPAPANSPAHGYQQSESSLCFWLCIGLMYSGPGCYSRQQDSERIGYSIEKEKVQQKVFFFPQLTSQSTGRQLLASTSMCVHLGYSITSILSFLAQMIVYFDVTNNVCFAKQKVTMCTCSSSRIVLVVFNSVLSIPSTCKIKAMLG